MPRFLGHVLQLSVDPLTRQVVKTFSKQVGAPYGARIVLKFTDKIAHDFLGLRLCADNGIDLGLNIRLDHVDGFCRCTQANAVAAGLLDDLRIFKAQLVNVGHHDAVALFSDVRERLGNLVVFGLDAGKLDQLPKKLGGGRDLKPRELAQHTEVALLGERDRNVRRSLSRIRIEDRPEADLLV